MSPDSDPAESGATESAASEATTDRAAADEPTADTATPNEATADRAIAGRVTAERVTADRATDDARSADWLGDDGPAPPAMPRRTTLVVAVLGLIAGLIALLLCCQAVGLVLSGLSTEVCRSQLCPPTGK